MDDSTEHEHITPKEITRADNTGVGIANATFSIKKLRYLISYSENEENRSDSQTRTIVDKLVPLLVSGVDIAGAVAGIYTWLLCDIGKGQGKQLYFKRALNANEFRTKHQHIIDDIFSDAFSTGENIDTILVYYGGEAKVEDSVKYTFNLLSGTYSDGVVSATNIGPRVKKEITKIMKNDNTKNKITFDETGKTFITPNNGDTAITEDNLTQLLNEGLKLDIYKFDLEDEKQKQIYGMVKHGYKMAVAVRDTKIGQFRRMRFTDDEIKQKVPPIPTIEEMEEYKLQKTTGGKCKTRKRKTRKRKTRKCKTNKRKNKRA